MPPTRPAPIVNAMTVDVEEYFHVTAVQEVLPPSRWPSLESRVEASMARVLDLLAARGVRATCFILGWVAQRHPALVRRIVDAGHEVASHGFAHQLVYQQSPAEFRDDVSRAKALLEDLGGEPVRGYRAPTFSITRRSLWALDVLAEVGYTYDASIFPVRHDRYGIAGAPRHVHVRDAGSRRIAEWPGSTVRVGGVNLAFAGGGYFRLLPYPVVRWALRRLNQAERQPAIFYVHPWEFDERQPRQPLPLLSRVRHYRNLKHTAARFDRLLAEFAFAPVRDLLPAVSS